MVIHISIEIIKYMEIAIPGHLIWGIMTDELLEFVNYPVLS